MNARISRSRRVFRLESLEDRNAPSHVGALAAVHTAHIAHSAVIAHVATPSRHVLHTQANLSAGEKSSDAKSGSRDMTPDSPSSKDVNDTPDKNETPDKQSASTDSSGRDNSPG
jgi:hypothetical protein